MSLNKGLAGCRAGIRSLRDLRAEHLPLMVNIRTKGCKVPPYRLVRYNPAMFAFVVPVNSGILPKDWRDL